MANFRVRLLAYAYHLREINLTGDSEAKSMRPEKIAELRATLLEDQRNQCFG